MAVTDDIADIVEGIAQQIVWPKPVYYLSGTRLAANSEWTKGPANITEKLPLIWLLENLNERFYGREASLERSSDLRIFFLEETNVRQFYTKDHRGQVVGPMQELAVEFMRIITQTTRFKQPENFQIKTYSRFGVEDNTRENRGVIKNVLDANLSGVELQLTLDIYKENSCSDF